MFDFRKQLNRRAIIGVLIAFTIFGSCPSCKESRKTIGDAHDKNGRNGKNHLTEREGGTRTHADKMEASVGDDYNSIKDKLENSSFDGFDEIWKSLSSFSGTSDEKRGLLEILVSKMCLAGKTEEAVSDVMGALGAGGLRSVILQSIFRQSPMSVGDLCALRKKLESENDREAAASGIVNAIVNLSNDKLLQLGDLSGLTKEEKAIFLSGLTLHLDAMMRNNGNLVDSLQIGLRVAEAIDTKSGGDSPFVASFLKEASLKYPFEVWNLLRNSQMSDTDSSLLPYVAERMAMSDPRRAMSAVLEVDSKAAGSVFTYWLRYDSKDAGQWYDSNLGKLSPTSKSQISAAFATDSLRTGNLDVAKKWLPAVDDIDQRNKLEGMVWTAERDNLRKQVGKDPAGMVDSIVSGQSNYADYWLEEAMGTWVAKDFDKAEEWYQKNWKSLPQSKSQYIAAAFANQALKQGDAVTASQWVALIQDRKTKQRIQDGINKAGAKTGK
ncbi:MAG: hypothetical protein ABI162_18305 [Luteolibacter sp.]